LGVATDFSDLRRLWCGWDEDLKAWASRVEDASRRDRECEFIKELATTARLLADSSPQFSYSYNRIECLLKLYDLRPIAPPGERLAIAKLWSKYGQEAIGVDELFSHREKGLAIVALLTRKNWLQFREATDKLYLTDSAVYFLKLFGWLDFLRLPKGGCSMKLAWNNCATNDPCALCGNRTDPVAGWEVFVDDSFSLVCDRCVMKAHPELISARQAANEMLLVKGL
jgi:hypothetical protein